MLIEPNLSTKETESNSDVYSNTNRRRGSSSRTSHTGVNGILRRSIDKQKHVRFEQPQKRLLRPWLISYHTNNSTLSFNEISKSLKSEFKLIPIQKRFKVYREVDIFNHQLESYNEENSETENDCDTDDETISNSRRLLIKNLRFAISEQKAKVKRKI